MWKPYKGRRMTCTVHAGEQVITFTDTFEKTVKEWLFDDEFDPTDPARMMSLVFHEHVIAVPTDAVWEREGQVLTLRIGASVVQLEVEGYGAQTLW